MAVLEVVERAEPRDDRAEPGVRGVLVVLRARGADLARGVERVDAEPARA